jgi:hypothetical protein
MICTIFCSLEHDRAGHAEDPFTRANPYTIRERQSANFRLESFNPFKVILDWRDLGVHDPE